jgi:hypothetical protein
MIRPLTCVCLILAAGSGLYLYQVKQRAFALDASLRSTFHEIDAARDRTRMLRADWALVNDPERLQALASQYLTLQPMQPSQLLTMDRLAAALPPPEPFPAKPPAAEPVVGKPAPVADPTLGVPMAEAAPQVLPHTNPVEPQVALLQPAAPQPAAPQPAAPQPPASQPAVPQPAAPQPVALAPLPPAVSVPLAPGFAATAPQPPTPVTHVALSPKPSSPKPSHRWAHHASPQAQPWLTAANGYQSTPRRHADHHATPDAAPRQFYAANVAPRITPPAATVMYSPAAGSSLGMASSAALAPPRPLYSTSQ